jgi:hypothetical protein
MNNNYIYIFSHSPHSNLPLIGVICMVDVIGSDILPIRLVKADSKMPARLPQPTLPVPSRITADHYQHWDKSGGSVKLTKHVQMQHQIGTAPRGCSAGKCVPPPRPVWFVVCCTDCSRKYRATLE